MMLIDCVLGLLFFGAVIYLFIGMCMTRQPIRYISRWERLAVIVLWLPLMLDARRRRYD